MRSSFVAVPWPYGGLSSLPFHGCSPDLVVSAGSSSVTASQASAEQIFQYAKSIGIGGIAMAGIIGIFKSRKIIMGAVGLAAQEMKGKGKSDTAVPRTQKDLPMKIIAVGSLSDLGGHPVVFLFRGHGRQPALHAHRSASRSRYRFSLHYGCGQRHCDCRQQPRIRNDADDPHPGFRHHGGRRPERSGWHGGRTDYGRVVCTALSTAGSFITDLKIGYWLGSTPKKQETFKFLGTLYQPPPWPESS